MWRTGSTHWRERMVNVHASMDLSSDHAGDYRADMCFLQLGTTCVWPATLGSVCLQRTPRLIGQSDPDGCNLALMLRGTKRLVQADMEGACGPGDLQIVDTSQPYDRYATDGDAVTVVGVEIPKVLVPLPRKKADGLVTRPLPGREGIGGLLTGFLTRLSQDAGSYRPSDGPCLETVLVDLFSALLAHELGSDDSLSPETRRRTLTLRIQSFIRQHLHDPDLTPAAIAAAHHISVGY
ncbi:AraC family transcriptional regulator [Streptomyces scopuliridis]|uniref:AraC-like ligand-binding domain-containing protein n=1 Tax=Streptomyces scopuliridis TaxID=452529 RepID=UPI0036B82E50